MPSPLFIIIPVAVIGIVGVIMTLKTLHDKHSSEGNTSIPCIPSVEEREYKKTDKKKGQRRRKEKDSDDERKVGDGSVEVVDYVEPNAWIDDDDDDDDWEGDHKSATDLSYDSPAVYSADSKCENLGVRRRRPSGCSSTSSVTNQIISPTSTPPSSPPTVNAYNISYVTPPTLNPSQSQPATQIPRPTLLTNSQSENLVTTHFPYSQSHPNVNQRPDLLYQFAGNSFHSHSTSNNFQPLAPSGNSEREFYNPINTGPQTPNAAIDPNFPYPPDTNFNTTLQPPYIPNHPPSPIQPPHMPNYPPSLLQPLHMPNHPASPYQLDPNQCHDLFRMFQEWYINNGHTESVSNPRSGSRRHRSHHKSRSRCDNTSQESSSSALDLGLANPSSSGSSTLSPPLSDAVPDSSSRHRCGSGSTTSSSYRSTKSSWHRSESATDTSCSNSTLSPNSNGSTTSSSDYCRSISHHAVAKECCICLEQASVVPMVILKPCKHRCFCKNCVEQLFDGERIKIKCPLCRTPIKSYKRLV